MRHGSRKTLYLVATLVIVQLAFLRISKLNAQSKFGAASFTVLTGQRTFVQKLSDAANMFAGQHSGKRFWVGYEFELRQGLAYDYLIVDEDGATYSSKHGRRFNRSRGPLDGGVVFRMSGEETNSLFLLFDSETQSVKAIKFVYNLREVALDDFPGFWFGKVETDQSFRFLSGLVDDDQHRDRVRESAIAVLSLHDHALGIPLLSGLVSASQPMDLREAAAFWLGQIPGSESFEALVKLYNAELGTEIKEKLIFSISQHEDRRNTELLTRIAKSDRNRDAREKAIFWLGQMAGRKTLDVLSDIIQSDEETEIKSKAVFALSQHENEREAADMLMDIARHNRNAEVRRKAMFWLGQMGDARAVDFFREVLTN